MAAVLPHRWPKHKAMRYFNLKEHQHEELVTFARSILEKHSLMGMTFKDTAKKTQLVHFIEACTADFPPTIRGFPEHEQVSLIIGTAQIVNYAYCRNNKISRWKQRRSLVRDSMVPDNSPGQMSFVLSDVEDGEEAGTPFPTPAAPAPAPQSGPQTPSMEIAEEIKPEVTPAATAVTPTVDTAGTARTAATTPIPQSKPLDSRTILVRNQLDSDCNGLCAISDLRYAAVDPENMSDLSIDDLDFDKWLDFLEQECDYIDTLHVLHHTTSQGDRVRIKSKWSWRAAIQIFLKTDSTTITFDMVGRKAPPSSKFTPIAPPKT